MDLRRLLREHFPELLPELFQRTIRIMFFETPPGILSGVYLEFLSWNRFGILPEFSFPGVSRIAEWNLLRFYQKFKLRKFPRILLGILPGISFWFLPWISCKIFQIFLRFPLQFFKFRKYSRDSSQNFIINSALNFVRELPSESSKDSFRKFFNNSFR